MANNPQPPAAAELVVLHHPYMELNYPRKIPTMEEIQTMEASVLLKLIRRSKWRSFPSGPQHCYEKSQTNTIINPAGDGDGSSISSRRITHLKIIDNTFYQRLQEVLAPPRILGQRPILAPPTILGQRWIMTKDIAIMDQLQVIELYRCTGTLPESMNHLNCLVRLQLDGCHDIDLSLLGLGLGLGGNTNNNRLQNLMELKITDCEDLTPIKFQNLSNLKRISLMRWDKRNNDTVNLGHRWINELSSATVVPTLQFRLSLQRITFSGSGLTNKDLRTILFRMLVDNKFPNLHTLIINDNPEINSFMDVSPTPSSYNYVPPLPTTMATNLKTIKLSGTSIKVNNEELDSVIYFLEKHPTVGIMKVFNYDSLLPIDQRKKINKIEYLLSMNSIDAFSMTGRPETIPLSVFPLAISKAFRKSYRTCNQDSDIRDEDNFKYEIRHDIVYHLLRNGPIFATGQTERYKRKRAYYPRVVKKQIKY
ncbi:hypothetical protein FRACYDRAFT_234861 [Fragilariopsis cylindrus CCMP1102]|uniref:RNI-like protein n=1 Tax=Fragilariopsis cylindrus CCMP1102 TaxID=635003 RepID=A0A1E7FSX4_9STRA|nr:hypothetical protein FRACYDRAFT_234861 [Fragilariopsis cylindrus CCMP1102]|eukprot:OEU21236.1 hypothetical protein FRACYDRAFT_234861 [Fragilariopsis cylindrus CCMP1102]